MSDLGTLGGLYSEGQAINLSGAVAGYSYTLAGNIQTFIDQNGTMTNLGALVPGGESMAFAINSSGAVAGSSTPAGGGAQHAFLDVGGKMTDLGLLPGGIYTAASGINNSGQVVAVIYTGGKFQDLNNLTPTGSGFVLTDATAINNNGQIVADGSNTTNGQNHAFLLTPS
jgi:probable HAF family extracellular repeat protein